MVRRRAGAVPPHPAWNFRRTSFLWRARRRRAAMAMPLLLSAEGQDIVHQGARRQAGAIGRHEAIVLTSTRARGGHCGGL